MPKKEKAPAQQAGALNSVCKRLAYFSNVIGHGGGGAGIPQGWQGPKPPQGFVRHAFAGAVRARRFAQPLKATMAATATKAKEIAFMIILLT